MDNSSDPENDFFVSQLAKGERQPGYQAIQTMFQQIYANNQNLPFQLVARSKSGQGQQKKAAPWANAPLKDIIPYVQALTIDDLESVVALENAAFPEQHRASREKIEYRLDEAGTYCLGLFASVEKSKLDEDIKESLITLEHALPIESSNPDRVAVLLSHIIVTKTSNSTVEDSDMAVPSDAEAEAGAAVGHDESGPNLALHSFATLPRYQRMGLGRVLMQSYLYRIRGCGVVDRICLLAKDDLVDAYKTMGFTLVGPSPVKFGGGGWNDMIHDIVHLNPGESDFEEDNKDDEEEEDEILESDYPSLRSESS